MAIVMITSHPMLAAIPLMVQGCERVRRELRPKKEFKTFIASDSSNF
jgi:hypothetical protein